MGVRAAGPAHAAGTRFAGADGSFIAGAAGSEHGQLFLELRRSAVGAFGPFPIARTHEDFAVFVAFFAMKFVKRHEDSLAVLFKNSSLR